MAASPKITVIVPVFNEGRTVVALLEKVRRQAVEPASLEVVVVDDGSTDGSLAALESRPELYDRLLALPSNRGKGAAIIAGLEAAGGEYVLCQDADLEYDPDDYKLLIQPILRHDADVVMGSRFRGSPVTRVAYFWHLVGNKSLTLLFNLLHNTTFTDIYSGYLVFRRRLIDPAELRTRGWSQQAEILSRAVTRGRRFYEVPISYFGRSYDEGKKIRARHAVGVLATIVACRLFFGRAGR